MEDMKECKFEFPPPKTPWLQSKAKRSQLANHYGDHDTIMISNITQFEHLVLIPHRKYQNSTSLLG